jgi:hypothetical protein
MPEKKTAHGRVIITTNGNGHSRDKVVKVTKVAVKTYKKAMKELEKH